MNLVASLTGEGWLQVRTPGSRRTQYAIALWRGRDGRVFGNGRITGAVETIFYAAFSSDPVALVLEDGRSISLQIAERGAGNDWADVYVSDPLPG